jgi:hypothetical protein
MAECPLAHRDFGDHPLRHVTKFPDVRCICCREGAVVELLATMSTRRLWSCRERAQLLASVSDDRLAVREEQVVEVELGEPPVCLA